MNILFTSHFFYPSVGGIEVISEILTQYFQGSGHSLRLITKSDGNFKEDNYRYGFRILRNPSVPKLLECYNWADIIFQNNIEVRQLWPNLLYRKPLVIGLQTWIRSSDGHNGFVESLKRLSLKCAAHVIACSHAVMVDSLHSATVIGNPYDSDLFRVMSIKRKSRSIVFLGRLVSDKGADLLINSFANLHDSLATLTIIGEGPERSYLESLVKSLHIVDRVTFLGGMQGISLVEELNQHEIMVVPSLWREPFGIVALEGLACGCVLLASDGGGLPDAVGNAGLLFKRGDTNDLVNKLRNMLNNTSMRVSLRNNAQSHLKAFSKEFVSGRYLSILESCLLERSK